MNTLYHEMMMELYKHPLNKQALAHPSIHHTEHNPNCGDKIELFIQVENTTIKDISWQGSGCAISEVGASLTTDYAKGKTKNALLATDKETILSLLGLETINPTRLRCAMLALEALKKSL